MESYSPNYYESSSFIVSNFLTQSFIQDLQDPEHGRPQWSERLRQLNDQVNQIAEAIPRGLTTDNAKALNNLLVRFKEAEAISQYPEYLPERAVSRDFYREIARLETKLTKLWDAARNQPTASAPLPPPATRTSGSKHDNVVAMEGVQNTVKTPGFFVPRPYGISSEEIQSFLHRVAPSALEQWEELCHLHQQMDPSTPFLEREIVKKKIEDIQSTIQAAFDHPDAYSGLEPSKEIATMITELQESKDYLMVRSTGAEDTAAAANAGGNISINYVPPNEEAMMHATGAVVASYFSIDSLKNRLDAKQNPFAEPLQLAVLLQKLIGEPVNNNNPKLIPSSFVGFGSEPLYVGDEPFLVMRIEATFGHGEGVVGTQGIATDSWLILQSELDPMKYYIIPDIKRKGTRKAPVQETPDGPVVLKTVTNPSEITKRPALSQGQLRSIIDNMRLMEARFGDKATDFEGVCRKDGTYFVQARPVNRPPHAANYVDVSGLTAEQSQAILARIQTKSMISPGHEVKITNPSQIIIADTLEQAEKLYNADLGHRLVLVTRPSPKLSHPVVNFSNLGMPCLIIKDRKAIEQMMERISPPIVLEVCTQTKRLYLWNTDIVPVETCVKPGFGKHPAQINPSPLVRSLRLDTTGETTDNIEDLLQEIRNAPTREEGLALLKALRKHPRIAHIQQASSQIRTLLHDNPQAPPKAREMGVALKQYLTVVNQTFDEAEAVFSHHHTLPGEKDRLQRLFHVEALEGILLGSEDDPGAVGRCSLIHVGPLLRATTALIDYQKGLAHPAKLADLLLDVTRIPNPDPAIFTEWRSFLLTMEETASPDEIKQFHMIMKALRKSGTLPMWFTFYFQPQKGIDGLRELIASIQPDLPFLEALNADRLQMKRLGEQIDRFAYPNTIGEARQELEAMVAKWSSDPLFQQIRSASPLAKNIAYLTMEQLVATMDTAIKTMKTGAGFIDKVEQTRLFSEMVGSFHSLMASWALSMIPENALPTRPNWGIPTYVDKVREILSSRPTNDPAQLLASRNFSVDAALLGANVEFSRHYPETLEDLFTLEHQLCLLFSSVLNTQLLSPEVINTSHLPVSFQQVLKVIEMPVSGHAIRRIGVTVSEDNIVYRGNLPLRNHSGQLELIYDKNTQQMTMKAIFTGQARERWGEISEWAQILNENALLALEGPVDVRPLEMNFTWNVNPTSISLAMDHYFDMGRHTIPAPISVGNASTFINYMMDHMDENRGIRRIVTEADVRFASRPTHGALRNKISQQWVLKHISQPVLLQAMIGFLAHVRGTFPVGALVITELLQQGRITPTEATQVIVASAKDLILSDQANQGIEMLTFGLSKGFINNAETANLVQEICRNPKDKTTQRFIEMAAKSSKVIVSHIPAELILDTAKQLTISGSGYEGIALLVHAREKQSITEADIGPLVNELCQTDALAEKFMWATSYAPDWMFHLIRPTLLLEHTTTSIHTKPSLNSFAHELDVLQRAASKTDGEGIFISSA